MFLFGMTIQKSWVPNFIVPESQLLQEIRTQEDQNNLLTRLLMHFSCQVGKWKHLLA
ncbi:CPA2 family monovalent cation:proton (H+) antiporter-2 [Schaalia cardiffensis F0333]|uniref:CPA2 family monovalent cation:proton (H+) antiporter-2 n=1 Tax=Schaalia cardiffensis F0333 TaxID=888050 RepID=N6X558_9ACTO|nr:CPA2 family monovalent cation:proton (H+) antiporter-2 [Schaalia cardiffensis F0333]